MLNRQRLRIRANQKPAQPLLQLPVSRLRRTDRIDDNDKAGPGLFFIVGLVGLHLFIFGALLVRGWFIAPAPVADDFEAAFHAPERTMPEPVISEPSMPAVDPLLDQSRVINLDPEPTPAAAGAAPLPRTPTLRLRGLEITQGIQVFNEPEHPRCNATPEHPDYIFCNNSMPLVAGRHTMVRVYLGCGDSCPTGETLVRLRASQSGQEQAVLSQQISAAEVQRVEGLSMLELRAQLENSLNFELIPPPDWLSGDVTFQLEAVEAEQPRFDFSLTRHFAVRKPLRIAYLPVEVNGASPVDLQETGYWLQRMYPVSQVDYFRLPMPDMVWQSDLNKSDLLHQLLYSYWFYAQAQPEAARPDQLFGWLPQEYYNGGASDPYWCPTCAGPHSSRVAFGGLRPEQDIGGPRILAHEIAHNLGAQHAWSPTYDEDNACFRAAGADIRVDPEWPYIDTPHIQEVGLDLYSIPPVVYSPAYYDMMAYCAQPWISPHTYRKMFESPLLQAGGAGRSASAEAQQAMAEADGGVALVSGIIYPDGTASRPEVVKLSKEAVGLADGFRPPLESVPPRGNDYCLDLQTGAQSRVRQHCFEVGFEDLETGLPTEPAPYFLALPLPDLQKINKVSLSQNQVEVAAAFPSPAAPQVELISPRGGEAVGRQVTVAWQASDADGDALRFDLLYSVDEGRSWLPLALRLAEPRYTFSTGQIMPGEHLRLRVLVHDGFHTTMAETDEPLELELSLDHDLQSPDKQF